MKKKLFIISFLVLIITPQIAWSLNWGTFERVSVDPSTNKRGVVVNEGFKSADQNDFPNCKSLNLQTQGEAIRQGKATYYEDETKKKIISYQNGIFDCFFGPNNEMRISLLEGVSELSTGNITITYKHDDFRRYQYFYKADEKKWRQITRSAKILRSDDDQTVVIRDAVGTEIQHAEKLYAFYKKVDVSSRSAPIYRNKILNNDVLNTSSINKSSPSLSPSSSSSKLPNCVGNYNEKTWTNCYGIYKWSTVNERYEGEFLNGKRHGFGSYFYANGSKYIGEWSNDRTNGKGTMIFASGAKYIGEVKNGKRHGQGTYFYADGERLTGKWNENEFVDANNYKKLDNDNSNFYRKSQSTENTKLRSSSSIKEYWWVVILLIGIIFFVYTQTKKDSNLNTERSFKPKTKEIHNIITLFVDGKKTLGFSFWIAYALLTTINFLLFSILDDYGAKNKLNSIIPDIFAWVVIGCYIFSCIGTWKSATNYKLQKIRNKEPFGWATAVYVTIVVMSVLLGIGFVQGFLEAI